MEERTGIAGMREVVADFDRLAAELATTKAELASETKRAQQLQRQLVAKEREAKRLQSELEQRGPVSGEDEAWLVRNQGHVDWINRPGFIRARVKLQGRGSPFIAETLAKAVKLARARGRSVD